MAIETNSSGPVARLTPEGLVAVERLVAARRARLTARLGDWTDDADHRLSAKLTELVRDLLCDPGRRDELLAARSR